MRPATVAAVALAGAGIALTAVAFIAGGDGSEPAPAARTPAPLTAGADDGRAVWAANGCGSCHTFEPAGATAQIGPDLALSLQGKSRGYILQSIVAPAAATATNWGMMPDDYNERISSEDLEKLVTFIEQGVEQ